MYATVSSCNDSFKSGREGLLRRGACEESLAQRLSDRANIYCPGSQEFKNSTQRWSTLEAPTFRATVEVATEGDVMEVVKYANEHELPFLAVNNAHGAITTVGQLQNGIMIWMRQLNSVKITEDGQMATFGGGVLDKAVTDALWAAGKQTVTGGCECVSVIGPGLGGGHGLLQARHGLVSDQFVSLNMVMADGSLKTIDHASDLWFAVRGAGHNFGIVTSITSKIYNVQFPNWAFRNFTFTGDKLEALYSNINEHFLKDDEQPVDLFHYSVILKNAAIDANNPIISFYILQEGVDIVEDAVVAPFLALGPVSTFSGSGDYPALPSWIGWGNNAATCQHSGLANTRFPIELQHYNITAQRSMYNLLSNTLNEIPALNRSVVLLEGYSQQGVKAFSSKESAYPFRGSNLLLAPVVRYIEEDEKLAKEGKDLGEALRDILHVGSGRVTKRTYVNYAFGTESFQEIYGDEFWRRKRLLALKKKYDPSGKFSFYAPIA
ncbi:FAD-binding domain-containing protein [Paraphaeosphaeria sporulosa]|uniref:FAD-binding domain-containing protein n=1 Tax=Paraphaeosphaeria sporulosa TaxID=1460663 RepID=A0A177C366_9PLEO|nr:FAD-binding domain-containing protein [Paraphaeosphaeria sporulosa]OAG01217.1 FAD-binding domain-containing protein [Paraphaeosphaeria sporulosa]